jgi:hypothetical protein
MKPNHHQRENNSTSSGTARPKKQRRISRACDFCHRRSIRCRPGQDDGNQCQNCSDFGLDCTFNRPLKRRRTKRDPKSHSRHELPSGEHATLLLPSTNPHISQNEPLHNTSHVHGRVEPRPGFQFSIDLSEDHQALVLNNLAKIQDLVTVYFEVVYPM